MCLVVDTFDHLSTVHHSKANGNEHNSIRLTRCRPVEGTGDSVRVAHVDQCYLGKCVADVGCAPRPCPASS